MLHPVIMAGGAGTRFWPRSRRQRPKQLIEIVGKGTMIQQTVARLHPIASLESVLIVTNVAQAEAMRRQLPDLAPEQIVAEPVGRDTAAAIGLAALIVAQKDPEGVMFVSSADHVIKPAEAFHQCIAAAARIARERRALVTFGVRPTGPSTRFGYLKRGKPVATGAIAAFELVAFAEKPDHATAKSFLQTGDFYWNSGNFVWRANDILEAIRVHLPELHAGLERIAPALGTEQEKSVLAVEYPRLPRISIDYGVMEKAANVIIVEATFDWDDVGAWDAVARHTSPDSHGNTVLARHVGIDTHNSVLVSEGRHLLATIGVADIIVVHTPDATLVCNRDRAADVKTLVAYIAEKGNTQYT